MTEGKTYRRVRGNQKILELLDELEVTTETDTSTTILEAYDVVVEAAACASQNDHARAIKLFQTAIQKGEDAALKLHQCNDDNDVTGTNIQWLIRAYRQQALSHLRLSQPNEALRAAQTACNLDNQSYVNWSVLIQVHQAKNDAESELRAIQRFLLHLPMNADNLPVSVQNERRELEFRKMKLEKQVAAT